MKTIVSFEMLVFCFALKHTINSAAPTGKMDVPWNKQKNPKLEKINIFEVSRNETKYSVNEPALKMQDFFTGNTVNE